MPSGGVAFKDGRRVQHRRRREEKLEAGFQELGCYGLQSFVVLWQGYFIKNHNSKLASRSRDYRAVAVLITNSVTGILSSHLLDESSRKCLQPIDLSATKVFVGRARHLGRRTADRNSNTCQEFLISDGSLIDDRTTTNRRC